ncbi:protein of unknown function [Limnospira indica PCC 8005]|uniref:Uncharacterized protein n=1 Tax=Limnospira indica PCC 8005 TaxID=376219 RepID=A0A9P1P2D3_9CYAN|nr:protein of unknown function [Limnospira indica PCC 8005]
MKSPSPSLYHSEPCLIVSHHTAPGVDTLFVKGAESRDLLSTSMFRAIALVKVVRTQL